jgi:hypothetical protein
MKGATLDRKTLEDAGTVPGARSESISATADTESSTNVTRNS